MMMISNERVVRQALTETGELDERGFETWICSHSDVSIKRRPNSGWTNLYSHVIARQSSP